MFVPRSVAVSKPSQLSSNSKKQSSSKLAEVALKPGQNTDKKLEISDCHSGCEIRPIDSRYSSEDKQGFESLRSKSGKSGGIRDEAEDADDDDQVVEKSEHQRYPKEGEPICVVCGRYGAYICDKTESDVCSLECKQNNLDKIKSFNSTNLTTITDKEGSSLNSSTACKGYMSPTDFGVFFKHNFIYKEHLVISNLEPAKIDFLREKLEIKLQGENIPSLIIDFRHCGFHLTLEENLTSNNYISPTPVQMQAIPIGLCGRDLLACAQTGTGKSASFLLPLIQRISATTGLIDRDSPCCQRPLALILCPTRELCMQLEQQAKTFSKGLKNVKTALIIGGNPLPQQLHRLKQGVQIIIATPGRLHDILEKHKAQCHLDYLQILVLDEVDTMLQLGFQTQVDRILEHVPNCSQRMMFSATIPLAIERIAAKFLQDPIFVSVGEPSAPNKSVKQIVLWVDETTKKKRLFDVINDKRHFCPPAVVFVDSKLGADMLAAAVNKVCGISCASLHGDKLQIDRTHILDEFLNGRYQVLVSTSLLGRGVDLLNVRMVINFDMPSTVEEYIHQVGRAGKLDAKGFAITFINNNNKDVFLKFTEMLQNAEINVPAEILNSHYLQLQKESRERKRGRHGAKRKVDDLVTTGNLMEMLKSYSQKRKR